MLVKLVAIFCLVLLLYQDLRYRAVNWVIYPALLLTLILLSIETLSVQTLLLHCGYNLVFILLQLTVLTAYFSLRRKKLVDLTKAHLGWGDILFFITIAFYLSPLNYMAFFISSLVLISIITLCLLSRYAISEVKIPLAGLQAILLAMLMIIDWNIAALNLLNDNYLLRLIQG